VSVEDLLQGWTDQEGNTVLVLMVNVSASYGSVVDNNDDTWTVTLTAYTGSVTLSYSISDGSNIRNASLSFDLAAVNDAPILSSAKAVLATGMEDIVYTITANSLLQGFT
jgi:hypothetical protein